MKKVLKKILKVFLKVIAIILCHIMAVSAVACKKMPNEGKEIRFGATVLRYVLVVIIIRTTE